MQDSLEKLLGKADDAAPPPPFTGDLAGRVRARLRRRRRAIQATSVTGLVLLCTVFLLHPQVPPRSEQPALSQADIARLRAEIADASSEAEAHEMTARLIERGRARFERLRQAQHVLEAPDALARTEDARARAALILVRSGDRMDAKPAARAQVIEVYRQAAQLFPDTPAGRVAAQRLKSFGV